MFKIKAETIFTLTLVFSGFYLAKITPVSPVYFTFVLGVISLFLFKLQSVNSRMILGINLYLGVFLGYLILSQLVIGTDINTFTNVLVSYLTFIILLYTGRSMSQSKIVKSSEWFVRFSILLLVIECVWRITHPTIQASTLEAIDQNEFLFIYPFKFNSFMFIDSNFVSIYSATIFFFCNYLLSVSTKRIRIYKTIFFILTVLTFSRAAILGIIGVSTLRWIIIQYRRRPMASILIGLPILLAGVVFIYNIVSNDDSFLSKFYIINQAISSVERSTLEVNLFGVGFGNAVNHLGIGSHNLVVTYLIESGFIGLIFMCGFSILYLLINKGVGWDIMLVFWVIGFSLSGHAVPFYYAQLAVLMALAKCTKIDTIHSHKLAL